MFRLCLRSLLGFGIFALCSSHHALGQEDKANFDFFEQRIRPVLIDACYECHNSADTAEGGLALDWKTPILDGGDNGPVIVPGNPDQSRLLAVLNHEIPGLEMPEGRPRLSEKIIADFRQWIEQGAPDPRLAPPSASESATLQAWETLFQRRSNWWSFQPLRFTPPPIAVPSDLSTSLQQWDSNPIDAFVSAKLVEKQLSPSSVASPNLIIRRLYFALLGLPPSSEELERWEAAFRTVSEMEYPRVVEKLTDSLLANPHFGERWARHWMDWIRYAESHGSEGDPSIPDAWQYRDYLIRSFNADVPINQMIREYIAGDLLKEPRIDQELQTNESSIGPAPWRMVFHGFAPTDALDERVRFLDDHINTMTKAFMGLTVSCARCHDHKFDPISQRDYFALYGIAASSRPARQVIDSPSRQSQSIAELTSLKSQIKDHISAMWLESLDTLPSRLIDRSKEAAESPNEESLLGTLASASKSNDLSAFWMNLVAAHPKEAHLSDARSSDTHPEAIHHSDLSQKATYANWIASGIGLPQQPTLAGEFAISATNQGIIDSLYPSGVVSNALSRKHAARLTSPVLSLHKESDLWVYAAGGGEATFRYAVQDYPRDGTVYPFPKLSPNWQWIRLNLDYWTGDEIHVEFAHAQDTPLPRSGSTHSWFAVKHVMLLPKGSPAPKTTISWVPSIIASANNSVPHSLQELALTTTAAIRDAVQAWQSNRLNDSQAWLLNQCLKEQILANDGASNPHLLSLVNQYRELESALPIPRRVPGFDDINTGDRPLFVRGDHKSPDSLVPRSFLSVFDATPFTSSGSGRSELASSILADSNPLTPRVMTNRIWYHLVGRGIVETPDNFGLLGDEPTHPELLDWLAIEFIRDGWSLKKLVRKIVTSKTWSLDAVPAPNTRTMDPNNQFLSHQNLRRLEAEPIRDLILAAAGTLDRTLFGPPVDGKSNRRSVYVSVRRNSLDPFLTAFNFPEPFACAGKRNATNVPAQSLMMMNDPMIRGQAEAWVTTLLRQLPDASTTTHATEMFSQLTGRRPNASEELQLQQFIGELDAAQKLVAAKRELLREQQLSIEQTLASIIEPARKKLFDSHHSQETSPPQPTSAPLPTLAWNFANSDEDRNTVSLHGTAHWKPEGLATGAQGFASIPLAADVQSKTLEVWVQLDNLHQSGGGVLSIQSSDGVLFDSIVFAELQPRHWLAGSELHKRTKPFRGMDEQEAHTSPVHIAVTHQANGQMNCYRNGQPYGESYATEAPRIYKAGESQLTFGLRHLPAGGNRYLNGTIVAARVYDRPLSPSEILASFENGPRIITESSVFATLDPDTQNRIQALRSELARIHQEIEASARYPRIDDSKAQLIELARALFTLQEAIFLQ